jgi:hypothetical protein
MSPGKDYAPCPHCSANNITHRRVCWRCGYTLPYTVGLDGKSHINAVSKAEIERLLDQAEVLDVVGQQKRMEAAGAHAAMRLQVEEMPLKMRALHWLRRRIERHSGA